MNIGERLPSGVDIHNFHVNYIKGSIKIEELFETGTIISFFEVVERSESVRYDSTGPSGYDTYYDIGNLGQKQSVKVIRVKGLIPTDFGAMRPFDVIISYDAGINGSLKEEISTTNSKIEVLANFFKKNSSIKPQ